MKTSSRSLSLSVLFAASTFWIQPILNAQGLPAEARENIHTLFNHHKAIKRQVTLTTNGYVAITESKDPKIAATLREHVNQMSQRLKSGRMVRRWDPAFPEYVSHYRDIHHKVTRTRHGLRIEVTGKTPAAVRAAQNHAKVILDFVENGWEAHDRKHPASQAAPSKTGAAGNRQACCRDAASPKTSRKACCRDKASRQKECCRGSRNKK